jgi:hypothetical protein
MDHFDNWASRHRVRAGLNADRAKVLAERAAIRKGCRLSIRELSSRIEGMPHPTSQNENRAFLPSRSVDSVEIRLTHLPTRPLA